MSDTRERAVLLHGAGVDLDPIADALSGEGVAWRPLPEELGALPEPMAPTVLLLGDQDAADFDRGPGGGAGGLAVDELPPAVVIVTWSEAAETTFRDYPSFFMAIPPAADERDALRVLQGAFRHAATRLAVVRAEAEVARTRDEIGELSQIGMALMTERDPDRLLEKILRRAMSMTRSDAGSLYLVEPGDVEVGEDGGAASRLRFKLSRNESIPDLPEVEFTLPIDRSSIAGYVADANEVLVLQDAYEIPDSAPYSFNRGFDEQFGYRAMSMLVVPMADHRDVVVGVIQLINRKDSPQAVIRSEEDARAHVLRYGEHELSLLRGLAGQAAVSIENAQLYEQIEDIFEAFVRAAVAAIDQRDPTTAGHSVRVAALTTQLAERLPRLARGPWAGTRLTRAQMKELRYAALLHDFGKVGVREEVLVKARKLPPHLWERVDARFDLIHRTLEKEYTERKLALIQQGAADHPEARLNDLDEELRERLRQLGAYREAVAKANEPAILPEEGEELLQVIADESFEGITGETAPYLRPEEVAFLTIPRGSLNESERREIESHVTQTYQFLSQIPWTEDLRGVAEIAYGHHEKLDGGGYPRGVRGADIPVQTRIMTIADIFDALTASDRPYKRALGEERALDILCMEADDGVLDADLVELMVESGVYRRILETDWRDL